MSGTFAFPEGEGGGSGGAAQGDIFGQIATRALARGGSDDAAWATLIADEYRTAFTQLRVSVAPEGPAPSPTRSPNATLMLLLAALENGDVWIRDCLVPVIEDGAGGVRYNGGLIVFDAGQMSVLVAYERHAKYPDELRWHGIESIQLTGGQRLTSTHVDRAWLRAYCPPLAVDSFGPMLQTSLRQQAGTAALRVVRVDVEGRTHGWTTDGAPVLVRDARGRTW